MSTYHAHVTYSSFCKCILACPSPVPSGKLTVCELEKSPSLMGKIAINGRFQ